MNKEEAIPYIVKDSNGITQTEIRYSADKYIDLDNAKAKLNNLRETINDYLDRIYNGLLDLPNEQTINIDGIEITSLVKEKADGIKTLKTNVKKSLDEAENDIIEIYNDIQRDLNQQAQQQADLYAKQYNEN